MKQVFYLILLSALLISSSLAVDTSNWVNGTSNAGFIFLIPPDWVSDPISQTTEVIRSDKSDAVLMISYENVSSTGFQISEANLTADVKNKLADLKIPRVDTVQYENNTINASGTTLDGTIVTARVKFDNNHLKRWICEYADSDAVMKYSNTLAAIMNSTEFT